MALRTGLLALVVWLAAAAAAQASNLVFVCAKDLAAAYAHDDGEPDNAIQRPGAIVLFDTRTARPVRDLTSGGGDSSPVLSPDGRRVAFERSGSTFTVPVAGGAARCLLRGAREPSWSR